jgi:hypothetical protein
MGATLRWLFGEDAPSYTPQEAPKLDPNPDASKPLTEAQIEANTKAQQEADAKWRDDLKKSRARRCQTCGGAKEKYKTSREAAVAQMREYGPKTGQDGYEYGGFINKNEDETFSPGETYRAENPNAPVDIGEQDKNADAFWHTHPADPSSSPGYNDVFWKGDADVARSTGVPGYVATPNGDIRYYDPASGMTGTMNKYGMNDYGTVIPEKAPR